MALRFTLAEAELHIHAFQGLAVWAGYEGLHPKHLSGSAQSTLGEEPQHELGAELDLALVVPLFTLEDGGERVVSQDPIRADSSFLTGAAGIALALLAAITPLEPDWDRRLLVAVAPDGHAQRVAHAA